MPRNLFADEDQEQQAAAPRNLFAEQPMPSDEDLQKQARIEQMKYITGSNRGPLDTIRDLAQGALTGLGKGGQFIATHINPNAPTVDFDELFSGIGSPNKSMGGEIAKDVGSYLPYGVAGGARLLPELAEGGLIKKLISSLANPGQVAAGGLHGAAMSGENESHGFGMLPSGPAGGALAEGILNAMTHGMFKGLEALRPSKMFRGNLPAEELQKNLDLTQGTETGLGDVIGSPFLKKRLENTLTSVPFSGANEALQRTGQLVENRGQNLLSEMLGDHDPHTVPQALTDELTSQFKLHQQNKNALYTDFNQMADKSGINLELPSFAKKANEYSDAINSTNLLKSEPDMAKIYNKLQNYKNPVEAVNVKGSIVDQNGKPIIDETSFKYPSFEEANILKGKLNQLAKSAAKSPDASQRNLANVFGNLASSLKNDIKEAIKGNPEIKAAYATAEDNYAKNFSPFLDRDIYKYVSGNADPETIVSKFIKTSPNSDLAAQLAKLATKMPLPKKNLLGYSYFSRALDNEGNLNPSTLSTSIKKLGRNQLKELVPDPSLRQRLLDYSKLQNMNKEAQYLMFNPKTGQRNTDAIMTGLLALGGHALTGNAAGVAAGLAPIALGRQMTKALTSPSLREALVKKMIENKMMFNKPGAIQGSQTLLQGLLNQPEEGNL